jgi:hypothetical protein
MLSDPSLALRLLSFRATSQHSAIRGRGLAGPSWLCLAFCLQLLGTPPMHLLSSLGCLLVATVTAAPHQQPFLQLSAEPPASSNLIFASFTSLLKQWPNTFYSNGHSVVAGEWLQPYFSLPALIRPFKGSFPRARCSTTLARRTTFRQRRSGSHSTPRCHWVSCRVEEASLVF